MKKLTEAVSKTPLLTGSSVEHKREEIRLNTGGYLVLTSAYPWLEQYTPKEKWLGGIKVNGENVTTLDGLSAVLSPHFTLVAQQDVPFVIRETRRKFQHTLAEMTVWQLK